MLANPSRRITTSTNDSQDDDEKFAEPFGEALHVETFVDQAPK